MGIIPEIKVIQHPKKSIDMIQVNKMKYKNHKIISIDTEKKIIWQNSTFISDKNLNKVGIEGTHLNIITVMHDKLTANTTLNVEKLQTFSFSLSSLLFNKVLKVLTTAIMQEKEKRPLNYERKNKTVTIYRSCNTTYKTTLKLPPKTLRNS